MKVAKHTELRLQIAARILCLETYMIDGWRMKYVPLCCYYQGQAESHLSATEAGG